MADETTTAVTTDTETATATTEQTTDETLGDAGKRALEAERRNAKAAAKERDALAARLKEFEDRDKTDQQKLAERADAAEKRVLDAEARALRLEIAAEKGLTPAQAKRLVGATREELEADATELLDTFKPAEDTTVTAATASLDLGNHGTAAATQAGPAADFEKFLNGQTGR